MKELRKEIESKRSRLPTQNILLKRIRTSKSLRDRALMSLCYLTAARINELLPKKSIEYSGLKKSDIEFVMKKNQRIMLVSLINEKNQTRKNKELPIVIEKDKEFVEIVEEYLNAIDENDVLFPFTKQRAWQIIWKYLKMNPHFIRHIRLSHLVLMYDYPDQKLIRFAGWSDSRPSKHYLEMKWEDLIY